MIRITGIAPARRRSGWVEIRLDGASAILLPGHETVGLGLEIGASIDPERLEAIERAAAHAEALRIALGYLSHRPRSRRELERHLVRKRVDPETVAWAVRRCAALGHVDDRGFAAAYARDRIRLRPCGKRRLRAELLSRGVGEREAWEGIREAMREEAVTERELLDREATRQARRLDRLEPAIARRRLYAALVRRGFSTDMIRRWIDEWADA